MKVNRRKPFIDVELLEARVDAYAEWFDTNENKLLGAVVVLVAALTCIY